MIWSTSVCGLRREPAPVTAKPQPGFLESPLHFGADGAAGVHGAREGVGFDGEVAGREARAVRHGERVAAHVGRDHGGDAIAIRHLLGGETTGFVRGALRAEALLLFGEELQRGGALGGFRCAGEGEAVGGVDHVLVAAGVLLLQPFRELARVAEHHLTVEEQQRLRRRGGDVALRDALERLGEVEDVEQRVRRVAEPLAVNGATRRELVGAGTAGGFELQLTGGGEDGVADLLGLEAADGEGPEEAIVGVEALGAGEFRIRRGLPIRRARHHQPVHRLQAPAALHERRGEPVQQLGVRGLFAELAEVARVGGEAATEVSLRSA